ncbi:MAG: hypothetical protein K2K70_00280 [Lachnospiraceae bacterium]|nr:hypothetical protein [Lachnospiraceae bacterium]
MNYKNLIKKFFVFLFLSIVLVGVIDVIQTIYTPNSYEVLERLLKRDENHTLNTSDEKKLNRDNYYQIVDGKLYLNQESGLVEYNYSTKKEKVLLAISSILNDYQIINDKIYYCKMNDSDNLNDMDLICRSLDGKKKKKILKNIAGFFYCGDEMIFYRYDENVDNDNGDRFYLYQEEGEPQLLFVNEEDSEDGCHPADPIFCWEGNIVFEGGGIGGYLAGYNLRTKQWQEYFNMCDTPKDRYYLQLDVQCIENYMFVHGTMCSTTKTAIAGPYYLYDAQETGVWQIDLITNERKQITQTVYHEGIYVLNGKLYGIDDGQCYLLYDNSLPESGSEANVTGN